jgi:hypothetical protein
MVTDLQSRPFRFDAARRYRGANIAEYWVVDLKENCLHVIHWL